MSERDRDEETGKYTDSYPDSDFLEAIRRREGMAGTSDVAEDVGCYYSTAYERLQELQDAGEVVSCEVGNSLVWSTVDE